MSNKVWIQYHMMNRNQAIKLDVTGKPAVFEGPVPKQKLKAIAGFELPVFIS